MTDNAIPEDKPLPVHPFLAWYEKNVLLIIPCAVLFIFGGISLVGFILSGVIYKAMKSTDAYTLAWTMAEGDAELRNRLGEPLKQGWGVAGKINLRGEEGDADFSFSVIGRNGKAEVLYKGIKKGGVWDFYLIEYKSIGGMPWKKTVVQKDPPVQEKK